MFIPTSTIATGKPVAFIPDTLNAGNALDFSNSPPYQLARDPLLAYVCAYWQEGTAAKRLACYGVVYVKLNPQQFPMGIDTPDFTFEDFLESADTVDVLFGSGAGFTASHKLGNAKPYTCDQGNWYPNFDSAYSPSDLAQLLAFPEYTPSNTTPWHKLIANKDLA